MCVRRKKVSGAILEEESRVCIETTWASFGIDGWMDGGATHIV